MIALLRAKCSDDRPQSSTTAVVIGLLILGVAVVSVAVGLMIYLAVELGKG